MRLRPVRLEDAAFIVWLRNLEHAKGRIGDSATDVASQKAWLQKYFDRPNDYYFLIETLGGSSATDCENRLEELIALLNGKCRA